MRKVLDKAWHLLTSPVINQQLQHQHQEYPWEPVSSQIMTGFRVKDQLLSKVIPMEKQRKSLKRGKHKWQKTIMIFISVKVKSLM